MPWRWPERLLGENAHEGVLLHALLAVLHAARGLGEQGVVGPDTDVVAGSIDGAALAHQDVPGQHLLAAVLLQTEPFRLGFAAVLGTAACLFMCHDASRCSAPASADDSDCVGLADDAGDLQ